MDRIVKILEVVDTRTWEEGADDKWYPIAGSGIEHECDRCGRFHEIHATVLLESGKTAVVGTGCMGHEDIEMAKRFQKADRAAKRVAQLEAQYVKDKAVMDAYQEAWAEVNALVPPEAHLEQKTHGPGPFRGKSFVVLVVGDVDVWLPNVETMEDWLKLDKYHMEERAHAAVSVWRDKRMLEHGFKHYPFQDPKYTLRDLEKVKQRLAEIMEES